MSGPGLNQRDAHHAIHRAAFSEAERLTLLLRQALRAGDQPHALQVIALLIEHWQTRTLRHAEAEETGWYRDVLAERPEAQSDVIALTRDHELLRILLDEIQGILAARGAAAGVVERFEAMLLLNGIHSREEERRLLGAEPVADEPSAEVGADGAPQPDVLSAAAPVPLAVARPALYARLVELLREHGLSPTDLQADLRANPEGQTILHAAFGSAFAQTMEWPLDADAHAAASDATEAALRQLADACERATQADYHARMRTPT
jgi:hypothetical protein